MAAIREFSVKTAAVVFVTYEYHVLTAKISLKNTPQKDTYLFAVDVFQRLSNLEIVAHRRKLYKLPLKMQAYTFHEM